VVANLPAIGSGPFRTASRRAQGDRVSPLLPFRVSKSTFDDDLTLLLFI